MKKESIISSIKYTLFFLAVVLLILNISLVSSLDIYSGDTINLTLEKQFDYYSIVGNSSEINLNIIQEGNIVWITFDKYTQDDSFEIVFFDIEKEVITVYQSSGGGGKTRTITKEVIKEVEVDNYVSVPNNTIEYVENKTVEEKIVDTGEVKLFMVILGLLCVGIIIGVLWYFMKRMNKKYSLENKENTDERRFNENE